MENALKKVQTETLYEVAYEGENYSVTHIEDADTDSGFFSWEVVDDEGMFVEGSLESEIIQFVIENM
jgi:hypothetical protein